MNGLLAHCPHAQDVRLVVRERERDGERAALKASAQSKHHVNRLSGHDLGRLDGVRVVSVAGDGVINSYIDTAVSKPGTHSCLPE